MQATFDHRWRRRALDGDGAAIDVMADEAIGPVYRFCLYRVGGNRHICEEVVQETMLRAIRDLGKYDPERSSNNIYPWLIGLARNEIQRALGRHNVGLSLEAMWERMDRELLDIFARLESQPFDRDLLERQETRELVNATMAQLPNNYRTALEAKYVNGQSVRDIAAGWQTTEKAVESLLTRARQAFRATFLALTRHWEPETC